MMVNFNESKLVTMEGDNLEGEEMGFLPFAFLAAKVGRRGLKFLGKGIRAGIRAGRRRRQQRRERQNDYQSTR